MAKLLFQGHGSYRITSAEGVVIYVDPYAGKGYDVSADIILVTHEHGDHNRLSLVTQKDDCTVIRSKDALVNGVYQSFDIKGVRIQAVSAYNSHHNKSECVGYLLTVDGVKVYASGDTSTTEEMSTFPALHIDYALLPIDGVYNMGPEEAAACAEAIAAEHAIPIHMMPGEIFSAEQAQKFKAANRLIVKAGEEIELA